MYEVKAGSNMSWSLLLFQMFAMIFAFCLYRYYWLNSLSMPGKLKVYDFRNGYTLDIPLKLITIAAPFYKYWRGWRLAIAWWEKKKESDSQFSHCCTFLVASCPSVDSYGSDFYQIIIFGPFAAPAQSTPTKSLSQEDLRKQRNPP